MNIAKAFSGFRGMPGLISRIGTAISRFGFTSSKFETFLELYSLLTRQTGCMATLPVTAVVLKRHPELIRRFNQKGIEFAVHGYLHIDYRQLSGNEQIEDYRKAIETFNDCQLPFTGFRAPYLRFNQETPSALSSLNFLYDSSDSIYWNVLNKYGYSHQSWNNYLRLLDYYHARNSLNYLSLPRYSEQKRLIEIPVSLPDDEAMVDRLGITGEAMITRIWNDILQETYQRGELFTLQLLPERINVCGNSLSAVINRAKQACPSVWIATLKEIGEWWKEKDKFTFTIHAREKGRYHFHARASERATLLVRNCQISCDSTEWSNGYRSVTSRDFIVTSPLIPVIGIGLNSAPSAAHFLQDEGFPVEVSNQEDKFGIYFKDLNNFQPSDEKRLIDHIERSDAPLVRFWRWPYQSRSTLTITGDIDSITLSDFILRLFEARQQKKREKYRVGVARAGATI